MIHRLAAMELCRKQGKEVLCSAQVKVVQKQRSVLAVEKMGFPDHEDTVTFFSHSLTERNNKM